MSTIWVRKIAYLKLAPDLRAHLCRERSVCSALGGGEEAGAVGVREADHEPRAKGAHRADHAGPAALPRRLLPEEALPRERAAAGAAHLHDALEPTSACPATLLRRFGKRTRPSPQKNNAIAIADAAISDAVKL